MALERIEIETEALASDIRTVTENTEQVQKQIQHMFEQIQELDQKWDGPANEAFQAQFNADHARMEELHSELRRLISCMEYARAQYDQCEDEVYQAIASIPLEGGA